MNSHLAPVPLEKAYRLLNHGPTTLISASFDGTSNVMAAAWVCPLDFSPPKLTVILDRNTKTRELAEKSGWLGIQIPTAAQVELTQKVGTKSGYDDPQKLENCGVTCFAMEGIDLPFVEGCSAWLACKILPHPDNETHYDLFIVEVVGAWADTRVFREGRWQFESADPAWRSIHHVAGGHYYTIGNPISSHSAQEI